MVIIDKNGQQSFCFYVWTNWSSS